MTILTLPALPAFQSATFRLASNTQLFTSPLSRSSQTLELPGAQWTLDARLPPLRDPDQVADWQVFFAQLRGQAGRFYAGDPLRKTPRGVATGTPLVKGGSQTGTSLLTDGWTSGVSRILRKGDHIAFQGGSRRELHVVTDDVASDGSGNATVPIEPPIRSAPADNAAIIVTAPTCIMMLADPTIGWDESEASIFGFAFSAIEALYG